jgi:hypothetical protein
LYSKPLSGHQLVSGQKNDYTWFFGFAAGVSLATESPWRLIDDGRIAVSSEDHGHQFGLPAPVDAASEVLSCADGRTIEAASISSFGDLIIQFSGRVQLQLLQLSRGYESWRLSAHGSESICLGEGGVAHVPGR